MGCDRPGLARILMLDQQQFRALFPALERTVWFDTPGAPPMSLPVGGRLRDALAQWEAGAFDWSAWDDVSTSTKPLFAELLGVDAAGVSTVNSVADAVAHVARSIPPGPVVVADAEYQSLIFPLEGAGALRPLVRVPSVEGVTDTDALIAAIPDGCSLLAVSDCLSSNGSRLDLDRLASACRERGARLLVDLTQSLGVIDYRFAADAPDFVVAHGYKWLGAPRGAAWLWAAPSVRGSLRSAAPGWRARPLPLDYFGGSVDELDEHRRLDGSHAWLSWIGAVPALETMLRLDRGDVQRHTFELRELWEEGARGLGFRFAAREQSSHISVMHGPEADAAELRHGGLRLLAAGGRVRAGFHYFNTRGDVERGLRVLEDALVSAR